MNYSYYTRRSFTACTIRASVEGLRTLHSLTRITFHPSLRSDCATRRSLRRLASIFLRQNSVFVRGKYLQLQPCQKQPSTKTAIFLPGQAKSGFPATLQCFRYPRTPAAYSNLPNGNSVVVFPRERMAAMILDRTCFGTWSIVEILKPVIFCRKDRDRLLESGRLEPACNAFPLRFSHPALQGLVQTKR